MIGVLFVVLLEKAKDGASGASWGCCDVRGCTGEGSSSFGSFFVTIQSFLMIIVMSRKLTKVEGEICVTSQVRTPKLSRSIA